MLRFLHRRFLACTLVRCAPPDRFWAGEGIVGWRVQWQGALPSHARLSILVLFDVSIPSRYYVSMIQSFADKRTAATFLGLRVRSLSIDLLRVARRKLAQLHQAGRVEDLAVPPGNRLEKLSGDRHGQWSIRINDQWRICFVWHDGHAWDVEIVDYHG